jgi:hypothetical protein
MKSQMPIWFRPYVWIPLMAAFYVVVPGLCDFSPYVLTHCMPYFLVGGSDWGGGNVFAFTKIVYWMSMIGGAVATCRSSASAPKGTAAGLWSFIFRNYGWHGLAAIALVLGWKFGDGFTDVGALGPLTAYLFAGVFSIVWTANALEKLNAPALRMAACVGLGMAWGLVPIGME